jgi:hypothetical protein
MAILAILSSHLIVGELVHSQSTVTSLQHPVQKK